MSGRGGPAGPGGPRADGPGATGSRRAPRDVELLVVSNGHGEDVIGARLAAGLARELPWLELEAFPLVGLGGAYADAGVAVVGPRRELPAAGLTLHHQRLLLADLAAGLLPLTLAQLGFLRRARPTAVLVVGDAYAQFMAGLTPAPRRVFQPLVSVHQSFDLSGRRIGATALHRTFMERIRAPERWLMARADKVYTRDAPTAEELRSRGLERVASLGNPVMDGLDAEPLVAPSAEPAGAAQRLVVALLPGTRAYAERSLAVMAETLRVLAGPLPRPAATRPGATGVGVEARAERPGGPASVLGLVAWARPGSPAPHSAWREVGAPAVAGVEGAWRLVDDAGDRSVGRGAELWFTRGRFAAVLASASVVLGTAGTANEQAAGVGLPVVAFTVPPDYGAAFLANQERLLGGALRVVEAEPERLASALLAASPASGQRTTAARVGPQRMGPPGGTAALVADLAVWLRELRAGGR